MASTERRGQFEQRLDELLNELSKVSGSIGNLNCSTLGPLPPPQSNNNLSKCSSIYTGSAPAIMLQDGGQREHALSSRNSTQSPASTTYSADNLHFSSSQKLYIRPSPPQNSPLHKQTPSPKKCSQIKLNSTSRQSSLTSPTTSGFLSPTHELMNLTHQPSRMTPGSPIGDLQMASVLMSPPSSNGEVDSNGKSEASSHKVASTASTRSTNLPSTSSLASSAAVTSNHHRQISGSRENTYDSTKYNSDTDSTMSRGSPASGSNSDFLSRLEQVAAKKPGQTTAPLPFSYLAMASGADASNGNSSSPDGSMTASFHHRQRNSPPQYQSSAGYYSNGTGGRNNNYEYEPYQQYDDYGRSSAGMRMRQPPPPPPPPPPKPGSHHQQYQRGARNGSAYSPSNSSYSPVASSMPSPTSSSAAYFAQGPGTGIITHAQYNSPLGLYSQDNAAEAFRMQTGGLITNATPIKNRQQQQPPPQQASNAGFQSTPLYKLIQEEEQRQQRRQTFQQSGGYGNLPRQYSADDGMNSYDTGVPQGSNRRITTMTMQRPRPGSSMAHFATPGIGAQNTPRDCYDQVLATLPRRPNRWSAATDRHHLADQKQNDASEIARQAAIRARCSSATRCLMNASPSEDGPYLEDKQIRYRGAKIPSRTFQLLHAYTEFTAKDDENRVAPTTSHDGAGDDNGQVTGTDGQIQTVIITDSSTRPRIRQRPPPEIVNRHLPRRRDQSEGSAHNRDPTAFERGAIQGDGPPRPAVPSRSFLALQAVLDSQQPAIPPPTAVENETQQNNDKSADNGGGEEVAEEKIVPENACTKSSNGETNEDVPDPVQSANDSEHKKQAHGTNRNFPAPKPTYQQVAPPASTLKVALAPTRIRPNVPRAPTWDRSTQPKRWEVYSHRNPVSKGLPEGLPMTLGNGYHYRPASNYNDSFNEASFRPPRSAAISDPENGVGLASDNIDEPYRLAKLKVMTGNNKGPTTAPRPAARPSSRNANNSHGDPPADGFSQYGDATDF